MTSLRLDVRLPNGPSAPAAARQALDGVDLHVGDEPYETVKLLVSELVTNSVRHGNADPSRNILLRVTSTHERIHVEVIDHGRGFSRPERTAQAGTPSPGGWGLFLTDQLASDWGVENDGTTCVWFDVPLASEQTGPRSQRRPLRRSTAR